MHAPANERATDAAHTDLIAEADRIKAMAVTDVPGAIALAHELLRNASSPRERVRLLSARAHALCYANDFTMAAADLADAAELARSARLEDEIGPLLLVRIQPLARSGRLEEAESAAMQARDALRISGLPAMLGKAEVNLGIVRRMRGFATESLECFQRAASLLSDDPVSLAAVHSNRAVALLELDRFDEATSAFGQAMEGLRASGRGHAAAIITGNIADLLARTGRIDEALARFDEARVMFVAVGAAADAARLTAEEAEALFIVGANVKSIRLLQESLDTLQESGLAREHARALLVFGLANLRAGNLPAASAALDSATQKATHAGASLLSAEARIGLIELAAAQGRFDEARRYAAEAVQMLEGRPIRRASTLLAWAGVELESGDLAAADDLAEQVRALLGDHAPAPLRARLGHVSARLYRARGELKPAFQQLCATIQLVESFRGAIRAEQIRTAYLESTQQLFLDHCELANLVLGQDDAAVAVFDTTERIRSRTLLDSLGLASSTMRNAGRWHGDVEIAEMNALYASLGPTSGDAPPDAERRQTRLRQLESLREAKNDRLGSANAPEQGPSLGAEPMPLQEAVRRLRMEDAVLSLYPDGNSISAQLIRHGGVVSYPALAPRSTVAAACRRFRLALARSLSCPGEAGDRRMRESLIELRRWLIEPVEPALQACTHLRLVPCGDLHGVPLHCAGMLPIGATRCAAARIESYLPGVTIGLSLAKVHQQRSGTRRVVVIGFGDELATSIETEAAEVAACHLGAVALLGGDAHADAALEAIGDAELVHLGCHAVFDPEFPMSSRLKLADRWVTARELVGHIRPGATVLLAGCETGRTRHALGEDRFGLVRALQASGAAAVLAAAWPLHDAVARRIMVDLHRRMSADGGSFASSLPACLSRVQCQLATESEPLDTWAGLFVSGALL